MSEALAPSNPLLALSQALADVVARTGHAAVAVRGRGPRAIASGVFWRPGVVVTVAHVFRRAPAAVALVGEGGQAVAATLVGIDSSTDLAVFRVADSGVAAATGDAAALRAGHLVMAVGRSADGDAVASHGIVQRASGAWQTWLGGTLDALIRLDGGLHDGLSGAPVADATGAVVGVATAALSRSHGIVIPASTVDRVVDALLAKGHVPRAFLGIGAQPVEVHAATAEATASAGLLVTSLAAQGPAAQAGVLVGDIVIAVGGHPATSLAALRAALADRVGAAVPLELSRGGVATTLAVTVGQWPTEARRC